MPLVSLSAGDYQPTPAVLQQAVSLIEKHHLNPVWATRDLPTDQGLEAFLTALQANDPYADLRAPVPKGRRLGVGANFIRSDGGVLALPVPGGPLADLAVVGAHQVLSVDGQKLDADALPALIARIDAASDKGGFLTIDLFSQEDGWRDEVQVRPILYQPRTIATRDMPGVHYMQVLGFLRNNTAQLAAAYLEQWQGSGLELLIDLRHATGGDVVEAVRFADLFVDKGLEIARRIDNTGDTHIYAAEASAMRKGPVLLIGPDTASASELVIAALIQHADARTIGQRTQGKCAAQAPFKLSDGARLSFSTHRLTGPDGRPCSREGIIPQFQVGSALLKMTPEVARRVARWLATDRWPQRQRQKRWPPTLKE